MITISIFTVFYTSSTEIALLLFFSLSQNAVRMVRIIILGRNVAFGVPHPQIEYLFSCGTASSVIGPDKSDQNIKSSVIIYHTLPANASILAVSDSNEFYQTSIKPRNKTIFKILLSIYIVRFSESQIQRSFYPTLFYFSSSRKCSPSLSSTCTEII